MKDYFEVLEISDDTSEQAVERAYGLMLSKYPAEQYPDKNKDIQEAYKMLTNPAIKSACLEFHCMALDSKQAYKTAQKAIKEGKFAEAASVLEKVLKSEKYTVHLNYLLGIVYMNLEKPSTAVEVLESVRQDYPYDVELNTLFIRACLDARECDKAIMWGKECYDSNKDNFTLVLLMAEAYLCTRDYGKAAAVLKEAVGNTAFAENKYNMISRLSYILFKDKKYNECLEWMERLTSLSASDEEKIEANHLFLAILDKLISGRKFSQAHRCTSIILDLLPDRGDISGVRGDIERILKLEPELNRLKDDSFIPEILKIYLTNGIFPEEPDDIPEQQQRAYAVLMEYQILNNFGENLMAIRYAKNEFPNLYEMKAEFLDAIQNSKERKRLTNKNMALFYQYQGVIEDMMNEWKGEYDEDDEYDEDEDDIYEEYDEDGYYDDEFDDDEYDDEFDDEDYEDEYDDEYDKDEYDD